jgi:hypothetical protein
MLFSSVFWGRLHIFDIAFERIVEFLLGRITTTTNQVPETYKQRSMFSKEDS